MTAYSNWKSVGFARQVLLLIFFVGMEVIIGCGSETDNKAPSFAGLKQAIVLNTTTAELAWSVATDDTSPASGIRYFIYIAASSRGQNFKSPQFTAAPGITTYAVSGLSSGQTHYFVVRAVDAAGNVDSNTVEKAVSLAEWQDPTGSTTPVSLNQDTVQGSADEPSLAFNNGQIYAAWVENNGSGGTNQTYMGSLNGTSWTVEGSLNQDPSKSSKEATIAFKEATPYVAWSEHDTTSGDVYVKQKNGASWNLLGGSLTISDPELSAIATIGHSPSVIPETPHIAFIQTDTAGVKQVFVRRWNGVTWDLLPGSNPVGSLNVDPANLAGLPVLAYVGTVPFVVWGEGPQKDIYVKRWNGVAWDIVGGKLNSGETNQHSWIAGNNQTVYVSWVEMNVSGVFQAYVAVWNEASLTWSKLGGSLNVDTGNEAKNARVAVAADGTVYSAWTEIDDLGIYQLYVRSWNGASWILEGGSQNVDSTLDVTEPHIAVNGTVPYVTWVETNGVTNGHVYVKALP